MELSADFFPVSPVQVPPGLLNPREHLESNCEQALGPDLQLPFRRWLYGLRACSTEFRAKRRNLGETFHVERRQLGNLSDPGANFFARRLQVFRVEHFSLKLLGLHLQAMNLTNFPLY